MARVYEIRADESSPRNIPSIKKELSSLMKQMAA